ncbi:hypothetical protein [Cellvibrio sp. NN19]|uniref:hypothetical protein n=1 Tax=Cellvibrio chitinivorans TaxID=3102792 RepID=UPI002B40F5E8|nr:hypothetical protein [Cellvibrio sp. NN19]
MPRFLSIRPLQGGLLLLLFIALSLGAYLHASYRFTEQLRAYIQENVIEQADKAELYSFNDATTQSYLVQEITRNLASLCAPGFFQVLNDCSAQVMSFKDLRYSDGAGSRFTLDFHQPPESKPPLLQVAVFYRINWFYLLGTQALLTLLVGLALALLPKPITPAQAMCIQTLRGYGADEKQAVQLAADPRIQTMSDAQLPWLLKGLELHPQALDKALLIAESPALLEFMPSTKSIRLHGLELTLADTPFFYFYWYALLRLSSDEGWYTNPAQTRPDLNNSHSLHALFEKYGGHAKAASELQEKGLRAKTLDQNRSKIKDELVRHIGEELAQPYLFDVQRDLRTARFNYRISLAPEFIKIVPDDLKLLRDQAQSTSPNELVND